jgi:hypothetical protein
MRTPLEQLSEDIEAYLDSQDGFSSLSDVYAVIGDVCRAKAEHVQEAWQDDGLAYLWERHAKACDKAREAFEREQRKID